MAPLLDAITIPPLIHLIVLLAIVVLVTSLLYGVRPPITQQKVFATVPWIVSGAILNVFYQVAEFLEVQIYPAWAAPVFSAPSIYLTTYAGIGLVLLISVVFRTQSPSVRQDRVATDLTAVGAGIMMSLLVVFIWQAVDPAFNPLNPISPILGLIAALAISFVVYILFGAWRTFYIAEARYVGWLVLFAHVFDAMTVTIGYDIIGLRGFPNVVGMFLSFSQDLPLYPYLGAGWFFVLAKIIVALLFIMLFADYLSEHRTRGNLLFAFAAVLGLAPALNNFLLYILNL